MPTTDLAIVGAGPAGAAAAISAAIHGLDTVLFDDPPRGPEPGETLPAGAEVLFRMLGVEDAINEAVTIRHRGHWSDWSGNMSFERFGADSSGIWRGFQIGRAALRRILLRRARQVDVRIVRQRCCGILNRGSAVAGVQTSTERLFTGLVVDATGASHWLARARGDRVCTASKRMVAWFGWASSARATEYAEPRMSVHNDGWTWIAQTERNVCAWVRLDSRPGAGRRFLLPESLKGFHSLGRERGIDVTRRIVEKQGGEGYFYAGDAGALLDPASGHGVVRALMTGMAAANHAVRIIRQARPAQLELSAYDRWIRAAFRREADALERFEMPERERQLSAPVRLVRGFARGISPNH